MNHSKYILKFIISNFYSQAYDRYLLFLLAAFIIATNLNAQALEVSSCPVMVKRSNGNGQAGSAAGDFRPAYTQNNPVAPNVTGTAYQLVAFNPSAKTGDIHFKWTSNTGLANLPVITRVWLTADGSTNAALSNIRFGPPSVAVASPPNYYVDYSFYNNNLPGQGRVTLEFSDPQTGTPAFTCTYDLRGNVTASQPTIDCTPTIITQPINQVLCGATTATFSIGSSGATTYQWQVSSDGTTFSNISNGGVYAGATTASLSIATPNTNNGKFYRVVLSASGCPSATSTAASLISNPAPAAVFTGASSYCGTASRSLGISLTGTAPFSVTYTVAGTPVTVNNISSSPYYIAVSPSVTTTVAITSVTDAYCTNNAPTGNTSVTINALPTIMPTNAMACLGSSSFPLSYTSTGSANRYTITAGTRAMPGFVSITNATLLASPVSVTIPNSGVAVGTYDFLISVNSSVTGCVSATVPFTVTVNNLPVVSASSGSNNVCAASSVNLLAAPANLSSYSWSASPTATISAVYNPTVNPTATTVYTVTGTDANGCQASGNVTVTILPGPTLAITPSAPTICSGNSTLLVASGGSAYSWSPSTGLSATAGATVIATPLVTTTYTVVSQSSSGCASTGTVTVTVSTPTISISNSSPTVCAGSGSTLTATAGFNTYSWFPVTGLYTDATFATAYTGTSITTVYAKPTSTTTYTVIGTTLAGCRANSSATVTITASPVDVANSVGNSFTFCATGTASFNFPINVTSAPTSMTWGYSTTQGGPYTSFTGAVSPAGATFTPSTTASTNATLTVSGYANGGYAGPRFLRLVIVTSTCTYNYDVQLFDTKGSGASLPSPSASQTTICSGASTTLTMGTLNTGLTIKWQSSTDNITFTDISGAITNNYTTPTLTTTTYYKAALAGTGSCGYTTGAATITVGGAIGSNTITPATSCTDGSTFIALSGSAITGGMYQWQRSTTSAVAGFTDIVGANSQNYTLTRNLVGVTTWYLRNASTSTCTSNSSTAVEVYALITNNVISNPGTTSYCVTAPAIALSGLVPAGGNGTYLYQWQSSTDGSTYTDISGATGQNYTTTSKTVTSYYKRKVTSGGCGLATSDAIVVTINANPTVTVSPASLSVCGGTSVTLTASGAASYLWSPSTELSTTTGSSTIATITASRTYTVTGTNTFGCSATASSVLTYTASPATPTVSSTNVTVCSTNMPYNLTALVTSGGTTEWYRAPVASATYLVSTPTAVSTAGTYYVFSKSGSCYSSSFASVILTVSDVTAPVLVSTSITLCAPATANLASLQPTAASGTILEWHTGSTSGSPLVSSPGAAGSGTYYLFAYSTAGNCYGPSSAAASVVINALPVATVSSGPVAVCQPATINLDTYNNTGNGTYTYQWYSVASNPTPATLISSPNVISATGNFYLYATSASGCKGTASAAVGVTINALPTAGITAPSTVCAATTISIPTTTNATSPVYTWQVSNNAGASYSNITNGGVYSGASTATLSIANSTGLDGYVYRYNVSGVTGCAATSENVIASVDGIATISTQPANYSTSANGSALFRISTAGSPTVNYQWKVSTNGGASYNAITNGSVYQGTNTPDLVILVATVGFNNYKYQCDISNNCTSTLSSSAATLTVSTCTTASVGGSVAGSNAVCTGANSSTLTLSGHTGTVLYWEYSTNNFATEGLVINNTTTTLTATNLTATTQYRTIVQSGSCATANSASATLTVNPVSVGGSIAGAAAVCTGTNSTTLTLSGHTGSVVKWQSSTDNFTTSADIANTTTTLTATNLTATTQYRAVVQSGSCATANSASATITVNPVSVGGSIAGTTAVCTGTNTTTLTLSGHTGSVVKWQSSTDNFTSATDISNTTTTLTATNLTATTQYRAVVQSGSCATANSTSATITVSPVTIGGSIAGTATVCAGTNTTTLTLSGHTGSVVKWQSSTDNFTSATDIANTTTTLTATNLTATTQYRAVVQSGSCATANSASATVTVSPASVGGSIAGAASVCTGTNSTTLTLSGLTGSVIKWQSSTNNFTLATDIANTTTTLTATNLTASTQYRAVVQSGSCATANSASATLTVNPVSVGGSIAGTASVCTGTNSTTLTLSGHTGSVVKWQSSTDNFTSATDIANTTTTLTATNLTATTQYRAVVQSGSCATANSASATLIVSPVSVGGSIAGTTAVCTGANSTTLTLSGHTGSVVKWQSSTDNFTSATDISNTTTTLTATNLTATTQYRAVIQSGSCATANSTSATITVNPNGTWIGGATGDWNNAVNWCGGVPTTPVSVSIPSGSVVTITNADAFAQNVTIATSGSLVMNGAGNLAISAGGTFSNSGSFNASSSTTGKVSFVGAGTISGTVLFKNIETYGPLNFGNGSTIGGEFTLQTGGSVIVNSPNYTCPGSSLIYRASSIFVRGLEWTSVTSGAGYPSNVYLQNNTTLNFPVAGPGYVCNDLIIDNGSALNQNYSGGSAPLTVARDVTITGTLSLGALAGGDINLGRNWTRNTGGVFTHNSRTVNFIGSYASAITAPVLTLSRDANGAFGGETFYKMGINKTTATDAVMLASHISVLKELQLLKGSFDLVNSDVTMVSKDEVTAAIAAIPTLGGAISGVNINYSGTGKFVIQRHLSMASSSVGRRWRMLTTPLQSVSAPTINQAWQQGVSNSDRNAPIDPWPGFGTAITKSPVYNASDGYDQGITSNPSMYYPINAAGNITWGVLPSTHIPITNYEGYMLFARGNRSIVVSTQFINANSTILEPRGRINNGDVQKTIKSGSQLIGNPYASAINFGNVTYTNYTSGGTTFNTTPASAAGAGITYYLWDPKTSGNFNVGKWITCSSNGDGTFAVTGNTSGLPTNGIIESSAAFMINSDIESGTLTFKETDKSVTSSSVGVSSRETGTDELISSLATNLLVGSASNASIADGVINSYHAAFRNQVDGQDAPGLSNFNTSDVLTIKSQGKNLAVERRNDIAESDTIFLNLQNVRRKGYVLQFKATNMKPTVNAILQDNFTGISSPISMTDTTTVAFEINEDAKSAATDRFRIVFNTVGTLPITFSLLKAVPQNNNIAVQWKMENEMNMVKYEVERSNNGREFSKVNTTVANGNSQPSSVYNWVDFNHSEGDNYYRIKGFSQNGETAYTKIVKVVMGMNKSSITVFPNPVQNQTIGLQFTNMIAGNYSMVLSNNIGQVVDRQKINYPGSNSVLNLKPTQRLSNGRYTMEIIHSNGYRQTLSILVQDNM